jgi:vacuolar-type H+-ATPase subunit I/STV1
MDNTKPKRMPSAYNTFVKEMMASRPTDQKVTDYMKEIAKKWSETKNDLVAKVEKVSKPFTPSKQIKKYLESSTELREKLDKKVQELKNKTKQ